MTRLRKGRPSPALVVAVVALIAALAGTAVAADPVATTAKLDKKEKKKVKKIAKKQARKFFNANIGNASVANADTATNAGTGRSTFKDGATQIPAPSTGTVLSLDVPAGSYLFIAKGALAKAGNTLISCTTTAGADSDTSLSHIAADANNTIVNTVVHTFDAAGTAQFRCQNPAGNPLFVTNAKLTAIPFAELENAPAP
jgi:biotin carboxyl carrier protein